ncbi:3-hydroxyacyl-CoA dehydrogenase NAD-binding domain-containing protein [Fontivita pretiosa]|uniref:3-hydroxyacyl-CoA dehydrogenase NAD-binding domain-containing protein n=1 Tax=Fontivita pretiosa TaxID=2989684 RepID=UPI003D17D07E
MATTLRVSIDPDRVMTITFDLPDRLINTLSSLVLRELDEAIQAAEKTAPRGIIFASAKNRSFLVGADLLELRQFTRHQLDEYLAIGQTLFTRIARLKLPTVAAINGDVLGGGLELALACGSRIAADDRAYAIGLPEVRLGLIPAFGATVRLPRLIGLTPALTLMTEGHTINSAEALRIGLFDQLVPRQQLLIAARRAILACPPNRSNFPPERSGVASPQQRNQILDQFEYELETRLHGHYPAPLRIIDLVRRGYEHGPDAALREPRRALLELIEGETGRNLLRVFFLRQSARRAAVEQAGSAAPATVQSAAILGGAASAAGIAHALLRAGLCVHLIHPHTPDPSADIQRLRQILTEDLDSGQIDQAEMDRCLGRLRTASEPAPLAEVDLVIEAAAEDPALKQELLAQADRIAQRASVLVSSTGVLSIESLARATSRPQRVIGIHFFDPVPRMGLVEIARTAASDPAAVATSVALVATRLGKIPILVNDSPGFIVNRILIVYLSEAMQLLSEGVPIELIDQTMVNWGMPMGPLMLMDMLGIDTVAVMFRAIGAQPQLAGRVTLPPALNDAVARGWLGRNSGRGFYIYTPHHHAAAPTAHRELIELIVKSHAPIPPADVIQWRLLAMMINEAVRLLEERVTSSTDAIDLASLLGLGMGPFRGGIIRFADSVGTRKLVERMKDLAAAHGRRFLPASLLSELAKSDRPIGEGRT